MQSDAEKDAEVQGILAEAETNADACKFPSLTGGRRPVTQGNLNTARPASMGARNLNVLMHSTNKQM